VVVTALSTVVVVPAADADPGYRAADHVTCFIHAIGPWKTGPGSVAAIGFGFQVHCTPHSPDLRGITTKLWRKDLNNGRFYQHAERYDNDATEPDKEIRYYASCSDASLLYGFHTEVHMDGFYGNWDPTSDNSDTVLLTC
jgi:hypothetical protein